MGRLLSIPKEYLKNFIAVILFTLISINPTYANQIGIASYYADRFHGRTTASGTKFNMYAMTAAHKKLKFGTKVKVTNLSNGKSVIVTINDRGPFIKGRIIDLSYGAAKRIGMLNSGISKVRISIING